MKLTFQWIMDRIKAPALPPDPQHSAPRCPFCGGEGSYIKDGVTTVCPSCSKPYTVTSDGCAYRDGQPGQAFSAPGSLAVGGDGGRGKNGQGGKGGDAYAGGQNSIAIGGKGGDCGD